MAAYNVVPLWSFREIYLSKQQTSETNKWHAIQIELYFFFKCSYVFKKQKIAFKNFKIVTLHYSGPDVSVATGKVIFNKSIQFESDTIMQMVHQTDISTPSI